MKTTIITAVTILSVLFSASSFAQSITEKFTHEKLTPEKLTLGTGHSKKLLIEDKILQREMSQPVQKKNLLGDYKDPKGDFSSVYINTAKKKKKSVGLGVLLSALVPGAGEFYGESYLKAGIFFGIELLAWGTYFYFDSKGDNKTEEFQKYADTYWDIRTYARWLKDEQFDESSQINPDEPNRDILEEQIRVCERENFSHTLPDYGTQQYYELIGKYQNFQGGWTNLQHVPTKANGPYWYETYRDPIFTNYADERQKANDFYEYAKIGPVTAIINHVLSAADAAWVISTYNSKIKVETGFRMNNVRSYYTNKIEQVPTFNVKVQF